MPFSFLAFLCFVDFISTEKILTDTKNVNPGGGVLTDFRGSKPTFRGYPHSPSPINGNPWIYYRDTQRCYLAYTTGPCKSSEMLVETPWSWFGRCIDKTLEAAFCSHRFPRHLHCACRVSLSPEDLPDHDTNQRVIMLGPVIRNPSGVARNFSFPKPQFQGYPHSSPGCPRPNNRNPWIYFGNKQSPRCHLAYTRGPCKSNEMLVETPWSWFGKCVAKEILNEYLQHRAHGNTLLRGCGSGGGSASHDNGNTCPVGQYRDINTGYCEYENNSDDKWDVDY